MHIHTCKNKGIFQFWEEIILKGYFLLYLLINFHVRVLCQIGMELKHKLTGKVTRGIVLTRKPGTVTQVRDLPNKETGPSLPPKLVTAGNADFFFSHLVSKDALLLTTGEEERRADDF